MLIDIYNLILIVFLQREHQLFFLMQLFWNSFSSQLGQLKIFGKTHTFILELFFFLWYELIFLLYIFDYFIFAPQLIFRPFELSLVLVNVTIQSLAFTL